MYINISFFVIMFKVITYKDICNNANWIHDPPRNCATYNVNAIGSKQSSISNLPLRVAIHFHLVVRDYVPILFSSLPSSFPRRIPSYNVVARRVPYLVFLQLDNSFLQFLLRSLLWSPSVSGETALDTRKKNAAVSPRSSPRACFSPRNCTSRGSTKIRSRRKRSII